MTKILLVEDSSDIMELNTSMLTMSGYEVICAENLKEAEEQLKLHDPDIIVLDILLPDGNGLDWCKKLKQRRSIPVLFLSALKENSDVVAGLRAGGDDYLAKPYGFNVLLARVELVLRKARESGRYISFGELKLDSYSQTASYAGQALFLTHREFSVLQLIMRYQKSSNGISKKELYETVWEQPLENDSNALWSSISRIKSKLAECKSGLTLSYSRQEGYRLERE